MNIGKFKVLFIFMIFIGCSRSTKISLFEKTIESQLKYALELDKDRYYIGAPLSLYFVIENATNQIIYVSDTPYQGFYIDGKQLEGYDIDIKNENNIIVEQSVTIDMHSGRYGIRKLNPAEVIKIRVHDIFKYKITEHTGEYTIKINKRFFVYSDKKEENNEYSNSPQDFRTKARVSKSAKINTVVLNNKID